MVGEQKELVRIRHGCALILPVSLSWHSRPPKHPDYDQQALSLCQLYCAVRLFHNVQGAKGMVEEVRCRQPALLCSKSNHKRCQSLTEDFVHTYQAHGSWHVIRTSAFPTLELLLPTRV